MVINAPKEVGEADQMRVMLIVDEGRLVDDVDAIAHQINRSFA